MYFNESPASSQQITRIENVSLDEYDDADDAAFVSFLETFELENTSTGRQSVDIFADLGGTTPKAEDVSPPPQPSQNFVPVGSKLPEEHTSALDEQDYVSLSREDVARLEATRADIDLPPFDRFRARKGRLSVSDLVGPIWCELQFQYVLEKGGPKRRTAAMKEGHVIHEALEKQVHTKVPFETDAAIPEEKLGLTFLNILSGLQELTIGGLTRELPVLGFLEGVLITGIIDELRYDSADVLNESHGATATLKFSTLHKSQQDRVLVLSDTKTRVARTEPGDQQIDQARLQLNLYFRLLKNLVDLDLSRLLIHENLDGDRPFSDYFISQALQVLESRAGSTDDMLTPILASNSLSGLWSMILPKLVAIHSELSTKMEVHYVHQKTRTSIATKKVDYNESWADERLKRVIAWWKGQRDPDGVSIEEAYKCGLCHFVEGCSWRLEKVRSQMEVKQKLRSQLEPKRKQKSSRTTPVGNETRSC